MRHPLNPILRSLAILALAVLAPAAQAADFFVPSDDYPNLAMAIAAARVSPFVDNTIYVAESPLMIAGTATLDNAFGPGRNLTIRPGGMRRATIASTNGAVRMFELNNCGNVTFQDLDIVRSVTNASDLIVIENDSHDVLIERCRMGSISNSTGAPGMSILKIDYPRKVVVRNCILFAYLPSTFDFGLWATNFNDNLRSLFLYNNVVADHKLAGIRVTDGLGAAGSLLLLRNNVVSNHPGLVAEPTNYVSEVDGLTEIATSHNVMFASAGFGEVRVGAARTIAGVGGATLIGMARAAADPSFVEQTWRILPAWDPNPDFWRLMPGGPLHDDLGDYGQNVTPAAPHPRDLAVTDDIERQGRPGGLVPNLHTDRGADQLEGGVALAVAPPASGTGLWAAPLQNPTHSIALRYRAGAAGSLQIELHDSAGRLLERRERQVVAGESAVFEASRAPRSGVVFYRLRLRGEDGGRFEARGQVAVLR